MQDLRRLRYVTENYTNLQGLRWIIWGFLCLAVAAEDGGWLPTFVLILVAMPVGVVLFLWSGYYYTHNFGHVEAPDNAHIEMLRIAVLGVTALTSFLVDRTIRPPIYIAPLVLAGGLAIIHRHVGRPYRWHYLALALLVAAADIALLWVELAPGTALLRPGVVLWTAIGLSLVISGFFDHRLLSQSLKPFK